MDKSTSFKESYNTNANSYLNPSTIKKDRPIKKNNEINYNFDPRTLKQKIKYNSISKSKIDMNNNSVIYKKIQPKIISQPVVTDKSFIKLNNTKIENRNKMLLAKNFNQRNCSVINKPLKNSRLYSKPKNEISTLSDITTSARRDNLSTIYENKDKNDMNTTNFLDDLKNHKSRNQRFDTYLKTNNVTDKSILSKKGTKARPASTMMDNLRKNENYIKYTLDSIRCKSGNKNSFNPFISSDKAKVSNNYNNLKKKLDKIKQNIETRNSYLSKK